jgi:16S rRNA processing protein RimM
VSTAALSDDPPRSSRDGLELGRIGSPYGIKGWVHVQSFTDPPERLLKYRDWTLETKHAAPAVMKVAEGRAQGAGVVARLEGIEDRDGAARLQGAVIKVARSVLPKLKKREFYQADLVGLQVSSIEGAALGTVAHFAETPGGAVMVVREAQGKERWVPATREHLVKVDLAAGHVIVDWPAELDGADSDSSQTDESPADEPQSDQE